MGLFSDVFGGGKASKGAKRASDLAEQQYADTAPYRRVGREAIDQLRGVYLTGERPFETSPGYDFRREEAMRGLERFMAARGLSGSGRAVRGAGRLLDDLASQEYGQNFNRLAALAGIGQTGTGMGGQALGQQGAYELAGGRARQSGYDRTSGAGINTLAGLAGLFS